MSNETFRISPLNVRVAVLLASCVTMPGFAVELANADLPAIPEASVATAPLLPAVSEGRPAPSQNVTINLINRLVQRGVLTKEDSVALIKMAEADAQLAREQAAATQNAASQAVAALQALSASQNNAPLGEVPFAPPLDTDDTFRVTHIPDSVRAQIRDEVKDDVLERARKEQWVNPTPVPDWVTRFKVTGDVRVRYEGIYFPDGNDNTGAFPNFNAINTGAPFDVSGSLFSPQLNVDQDRQRFRLRARLGTEVQLGDGFTSGLRLATGENNSPVSANQSFGVANQGQGGNFSRYAIWLDRAFLKYEVGPSATRLLTISVGRFDNPFFASDVMWDDDIGFDGLAIQARTEVMPGVIPFLTAGAFPVFNTDLNFSSNQPSKFESTDKWLYAVQVGSDWKINRDFSTKWGLAYYHFEDVEGVLSDPYTPLNSQDAGNTDNTRPSFAQKGNTYMALRNIVPSALNNFGTINQFQYFGLATPFHQIAVTGRVDYNHFEPIQVSLMGEYINNLAFEKGAVNRVAVNNRGSKTGGKGAFEGGNTAWSLNLKAGNAVLEKRWDWQVSAGYRYVESDAVVDGFTDSDFGGGGTNLKGYTLSGSLALSPRVWIGLRWLSADSIAGSPYKNDIIQFDFNGKF